MIKYRKPYGIVAIVALAITLLLGVIFTSQITDSNEPVNDFFNIWDKSLFNLNNFSTGDISFDYLYNSTNYTRLYCGFPYKFFCYGTVGSNSVSAVSPLAFIVDFLVFFGVVSLFFKEQPKKAKTPKYDYGGF